jgi:hypothetical protein
MQGIGLKIAYRRPHLAQSSHLKVSGRLEDFHMGNNERLEAVTEELAMTGLKIGICSTYCVDELRVSKAKKGCSFTADLAREICAIAPLTPTAAAGYPVSFD